MLSPHPGLPLLPVAGGRQEPQPRLGGGSWGCVVSFPEGQLPRLSLPSGSSSRKKKELVQARLVEAVALSHSIQQASLQSHSVSSCLALPAVCSEEPAQPWGVESPQLPRCWAPETAPERQLASRLRQHAAGLHGPPPLPGGFVCCLFCLFCQRQIPCSEVMLTRFAGAMTPQAGHAVPSAPLAVNSCQRPSFTGSDLLP